MPEVWMIHKFLRAVGFSMFKNNQDILPLLNTLIQKAGSAVLIQDEGIVNGQFTRDFGEGIGVAVYGDFTENDVFHPEYYFPYNSIGVEAPGEVLTVNRFADKNAYCAMCEEPSFGVSLIFHVINGLEYAKKSESSNEPPKIKGVTLSALSVYGKIIMPVMQQEKELAVIRASNSVQRTLMEAAEKGDSNALEDLAMQDMRLANVIGERSAHEDIYSIVSTSFMPFGLESDQYTVIGVIEECDAIKNTLTEEEMYRMIIQCNDVRFSVVINSQDLIGIPEPGRRFKGEIWMQGVLSFE
jgi:hypothetical protein